MTIPKIASQLYSRAALSSPQTTVDDNASAIAADAVRQLGTRLAPGAEICWNRVTPLERPSGQNPMLAVLDNLIFTLDFFEAHQEESGRVRECIIEIGNQSQGQDVLQLMYLLIAPALPALLIRDSVLSADNSSLHIWSIVSLVAIHPADRRLNAMRVAQRLVQGESNLVRIVQGVRTALSLGVQGPLLDSQNCAPQILQWIEDHHDGKEGKCAIFNKIFLELCKDYFWNNRRTQYQQWVEQAPARSAARVERRQVMENLCPTKTPEQRIENMGLILKLTHEQIGKNESANTIIARLNELISMYRIEFESFISSYEQQLQALQSIPNTQTSQQPEST